MGASSRAATATALGAAVLVLGTDAATFGATGSSLILGHLNSSRMTTTLTTTGAGPAMRLQSSPNRPPLAVNGDAKVRNLNADELDGRTATQLASHAVTFSAGKRGDVIAAMQIWNLPVAPGAYQVSFKAIVVPADGTPQAPVQVICGVADLKTIGPRTHVYTADSATYIGSFPAIMSGAEAVRVKVGQSPVLICTTAADSAGTEFTLFKPVTASFTQLNSREVRTAEPVPAPVGRVRLLPR